MDFRARLVQQRLMRRHADTQTLTIHGRDHVAKIEDGARGKQWTGFVRLPRVAT